MQAESHTLKNGALLTIRSVELQDAGAVLAYVEAVSAESDYLSFGPGEFGVSVDEERAFIASTLAEGNRLFIAGLVNDQIVSLLTFCGGARPRHRHAGELGMSVRRAYWDQGVGGAMLDCCIDRARAGGIVTKINLRVRTDNARAIALYERKGFMREGTIRRDVLVRGRYYDHHVMGLVL